MKHVYFMRRSDGTGPIKIGCSVYPDSRRKQIGFDLSMSFDLLAEVPGDFAAERSVHAKFAAIRTSPNFDQKRPYLIGCPTEWFEPTNELLAYIELVKSLGFIPPSSEGVRETIFVDRFMRGETLQSIASDFGMSRERVRQILKAQGITARTRAMQGAA